METIKIKSNVVYPIVISLIMVLVFLINQSIVSSNAIFLLSILLIGLSFYYVPYRLLKNSETIISKRIDVFSNLIFGITCGYINVLLFTNDPSVITVGNILVIVSSLFSYYILYLKKENSREIFISHFIVIFFLIGLLKFIVK